MEAPHNIESLRVSGEETLCFFKTQWGLKSDFPSRQILPLHQGPSPGLITMTCDEEHLSGIDIYVLPVAPYLSQECKLY